MKYAILIAFFMSLCAGSQAQESFRPRRQVMLSVFNASALLPGGGDFWITSSVVHPGVDLGMGWSFGAKPKSEWLANAKAGYFYHRLSQHAIQLFGEAGYRRFFWRNRFNLSALLVGGYLHAIPDLQVFEIGDNGAYGASGKSSRPQGMLGLSLVPAYSWKWNKRTDCSVFLGYRFMVQAPFIQNYVNILPYTSLHLGMTASLDQLIKNGKQ